MGPTEHEPRLKMGNFADLFKLYYLTFRLFFRTRKNLIWMGQMALILIGMTCARLIFSFHVEILVMGP